MEEPLNTIGYFVAGYTVIFGIILIYIVSLIIRWQNLKREEEILTEDESTK